MTITLSVDATPRIFSSLEKADDYAKVVWKRGYFSDINYYVEDGNFMWSGSIDLEPSSFHEPHKDSIVTNHIRTVATNMAKESRIFMVRPETRYAAIELLCLIPKS